MAMLDYQDYRTLHTHTTQPLLFFPLRFSLTLSIYSFLPLPFISTSLRSPSHFLSFRVTLLSLSNSGGYRPTLAPLFCSGPFRSSTFVSPAGSRWRWPLFSSALAPIFSPCPKDGWSFVKAWYKASLWEEDLIVQLDTVLHVLELIVLCYYVYYAQFCS